MSLQFARRTRDRDAERAWAEVEVAASTNQEALSAMRLWVRALNPPPPRVDVGGAEAFDGIVEGFRGTGLEVSLEHHGDTDPLPDHVSLFATRLIQESLTNVLRHSSADAATIVVTQSPHQVRLAVRDNGVGAQATPEGFGLRALRERAEDLGGTVVAAPTHSRGWEIAAVVPLRYAASPGPRSPGVPGPGAAQEGDS